MDVDGQSLYLLLYTIQYDLITTTPPVPSKSVTVFWMPPYNCVAMCCKGRACATRLCHCDLDVIVYKVTVIRSDCSPLTGHGAPSVALHPQGQGLTFVSQKNLVPHDACHVQCLYRLPTAMQLAWGETSALLGPFHASLDAYHLAWRTQECTGDCGYLEAMS